MSLFIDTKTLTIPSKIKASEKTADDVLQMVQNRIRNWAKASDNGAKKPEGVANILVEREVKVNGAKQKGKYLLVKIANRTLTAMRWDTSQDGASQVEACINALESEKDTLHTLYKEVCNQLPNSRKGTAFQEVANG